MAVKQSLRKTIREKLAGIDPTVLQAKSMAACKHLMDQPEFRQARVIMIYMPLAREVDVSPIALRSWQEDKTVAAPRLSWSQRHMLPVEIRSLESGLTTTRHGLREPAEGEPVPVDMIDMVIVPAMAYDRKGNRLGRGAGFYDRFLASLYFRGLAVGLAFREQVVDQVPVQEGDQPVHMLVTDEEVLRFGAPRSRGGADKEK